MSHSRRQDMLRGTLDMMVLNVLSSGPKHGYGVMRELHRLSDRELVIEEGSLYPALHRLERQGFLTAEWRQTQQNRKAKYYSITASGTAHLAFQRTEWDTLVRTIRRVMADGRAFAGMRPI